MEVLWLSGWGLDPEWWEARVRARWPHHRHHCLPPTRSSLEVCAASEAEVVVGYSLGAAMLMARPPVSRDGASVRLLAPFVDLRTGHHGGGKVEVTRIKWLRRWTARDPLDAISDFYLRAGLDLPKPTSLPYALDDLLWGLDVMIEGVQAALGSTEDERTADFRSRAAAWVGSADALVDASAMKQQLPALEVIPDATHDPRTLLLKLRLEAEGAPTP